MARQHARRRRRERAAGIAVVVLGAVVLIVAVFALNEPKGHVSSGPKSTVVKTVVRSSHPSTRPPSSHSGSGSTSSGSSGSSGSSNPPGSSGPKSVPIVVLNNTETSGLAQQAAQRFEQGGWTVRKYDNYQNDIISTCAYYDPNNALAKQAAEQLQQQYPTIQRVEPKFAGLGYGPLVVILTPDYTP